MGYFCNNVCTKPFYLLRSQDAYDSHNLYLHIQNRLDNLLLNFVIILAEGIFIFTESLERILEDIYDLINYIFSITINRIVEIAMSVVTLSSLSDLEMKHIFSISARCK